MGLFLVGFLLFLVNGKWVDGLLEFNETELSYIESYVHDFASSKAAYYSNAVMVSLTLIQSAGAKGAGTKYRNALYFLLINS